MSTDLVVPNFLPHVNGKGEASAAPTSPEEERIPRALDFERVLAERTVFRRADAKAAEIVAAETAARVAAEKHGGRNTWQPEDISDVLDGTRDPVVTELGHRADGVPILYRGKEHGIAGEPESGKTWFALMIVVQVLKKGHRVTYVDFEDDARTVVGRLLDLGLIKERLRRDSDQFRYIRPEAAPGEDDITAAITFGGGTADLVVYDGFTEGAALLGLDVTGGDGQAAVAKFRRTVIRPALTAGAATLITDHVVKSSDSRNRYALGAQHKLAGLTGAQFMIEVEKTWGRGRKGRSKIYITKDRNAALREASQPDPRPNFDHFGDLVGNAEDPEMGITVVLFAPRSEQEGIEKAVAEGQPDPKLAPAVDRVIEVLQGSEEPLSGNRVAVLAGGRKQTALDALEWLVAKGRVTRTKNGATFFHALTPEPVEDVADEPAVALKAA
ncbi:hypothetical protein [Dactylosporangium sp. NPDC051484]|uniref:hypothetical protein n=1 Tax=Dactylosporangium sp. NPDC051484 TaxID=3154942 RepID=UPI00344B7A3F